jgi:hypothetical protein
MSFFGRLLFLVLVFFKNTSFVYAYEGYIKHKIINKTPYELYVGVRQQFSYPIETCQGIIVGNSEKECEGAFEIGYSNFMIEIIKSSVTREELKAFANFKNYSQNPSFMVSWIINLDESDNIKVSYQAINL